MKRLAYTQFRLPVFELRRGLFSAVYFWREKQILEANSRQERVLMQVFQKGAQVVLGGMDEALSILRVATGYWRDESEASVCFQEYLKWQQKQYVLQVRQRWDQLSDLDQDGLDIQKKLSTLWVDTHADLSIEAMVDGDVLEPYQAVLTIDGKASDFSHLESIYLGVLARSTKIATHVKRVVQVAQGKPVLFFSDRFDRFENQFSDGYTALRAGVSGVATPAMGKWLREPAIGTIPHALIAVFQGDTAEATLAFSQKYPQERAIALVDFHNDCVKTSLQVAKAFRDSGKILWGVRLDTSESLVDISLKDSPSSSEYQGVCPALVFSVRQALDEHGFDAVKIVVSGGFHPDRIVAFESKKVPVDAYGVGSYMLHGSVDFTADIVRVQGQPMAKVGRSYQPSSLLRPFSFEEIEDLAYE